jgi:hypothetical protein
VLNLLGYVVRPASPAQGQQRDSPHRHHWDEGAAYHPSGLDTPPTYDLGPIYLIAGLHRRLAVEVGAVRGRSIPNRARALRRRVKSGVTRLSRTKNFTGAHVPTISRRTLCKLSCVSGRLTTLPHRRAI